MDIKKFMTPITRRSLFRDLSAGAMMLTFAPMQRAFSQEASVYGKRFINFFVGNGMVPSAFYPSTTSAVSPLTANMFGDGDSDPGFCLNPIAQHGLLEKTTIIRGIHFLDLVGLNPNGPSHGNGGIASMSGGSYSGGRWTEPSIDQVIALNQDNQDHAIASILLNADRTRKKSKERLTYSWSASGNNVNPIGEVFGVSNSFDALFNGFNFPSGDSSPGTIVTPGNDKMLSLIDFNLGQINKLRSRLGSEEKKQLEEHLDHCASMGKRFAASSQQSVGAQCSEPSEMSDGNHSAMVDGQLNNLVAALRCGRLNVATMILQGSGSDVLYSNEIDMNQNIEHHGISHEDNSAGLAAHARINRWAVNKVAGFAAELDKVPEGGGTMLDNSIICLSYELGKGRGHDHFDVAQVIFGKGGEQYKGGQYLNYGSGQNAGIPVNDVLLSHCRAMGIGEQKLEVVGEKSKATGEIASALFK